MIKPINIGKVIIYRCPPTWAVEWADVYYHDGTIERLPTGSYGVWRENGWFKDVEIHEAIVNEKS